MVFGFVLLIHIVVCLIIYILKRQNVLYIDSLIMPMVVFIPFWGMIALLIEEFLVRKNKMGTKVIGVEKLIITDKKYNRIHIKKDENQEITVPLEEAILINDTKTRRALMLEVLHKNPDEYVSMLQKTSLSKDVELVHYATTTIMEIQGDYEREIHKLDAILKKDPDNEKKLKEYKEILLKYLNSGILSGNIQVIQRVQLKKVLEKLINLYPEKKIYYLQYIENELELNQYTNVDNMLTIAKKKWPEEEAIYKLYVDYYWNTGRGNQIQELLIEIKEKNIYLSREGREWYQFWRKGKIDR